jgi:hypothetical protein
MEQLFAGLAGEGTTEASGLGFTLESARAREKLQEFALAQPENYQLLAIAGLYALGCRDFRITIDADDLRIEGDHPLPREPFHDLWSFVSRGSTDGLVIGCRLLAMAILTSVRLEEMEWHLQSTDDRGGWECQVRVRRGLLSEVAVQPSNQACAGVAVWARRRAFGQVARRFFIRWFNGRRQREQADEGLLRQRLFLDRGSRVVCNDQSLVQATVPDGAVWAVLKTGQAPDLVDCPFTHTLERDYSMSLLMCPPGREQADSLPGKANHVLWIWNGLSMDMTTLGAELGCFRAFVWASELRPDLSFTSLVDNRDKQTLERHVRSLARELLDRWVRALSAEMVEDSKLRPVRYRERLALLRSLVLQRLDPIKSWERLASLNRALVDCPLVVGSGPEGGRRWVTLRELRGEILEGRQLAAVLDDPSLSFPACPGRPLVLYLDSQEYEFLFGRFFRVEPVRGEDVLKALAALRQPVPPVAPTEQSALNGRVSVRGVPVEWSIGLAASRGKPMESGVLRVRGSGGTTFDDRSLGLPRGMLAYAQADWLPSYHGTLVDQELAAELQSVLLADVGCALGESDGPPDEMAYHLAGLLLTALGQLTSWPHPLQASRWLPVIRLNGQRLSMSPQELQRELNGTPARPLYSLSWSDPLPESVPSAWSELPLLLAPSSGRQGAQRLLERAVHDGRAFARLGSRPAPEWNEQELVWWGSLEQPEVISWHLRAFRLGIPYRHSGLKQGSLSVFLQGRFWAEQPAQPHQHALLSVDWVDRLPCLEGSDCLGQPEAEQALDILRRACRCLAQQFFAQATPDQLWAAHPELLGELMFELLSESETAQLPLFLSVDGRRRALHELGDEVTYLSDPPEDSNRLRRLEPSTVYLPGSLPEVISLLSEADWSPHRPPPFPGPPGGQRAVPPSASGPPTALLGVVQASKSGSKAGKALGAASETGKPPKGDSRVGKAAKGDAAAEKPRWVLPRPATGKPTAVTSSTEQPVGVSPPASQSPPAQETPAEEVLQEVPARQRPALDPTPTESSPTPTRAPAESTALESELWRGLNQELERLDWEPPPDFSRFLRRARFAHEQQFAASLDSRGELVLGQPCWQALQSETGRLMLLSAAFSLHNRQSSRVTDRHERLFHARLLERALADSLRVGGSRSQEPWGGEGKEAQRDRAKLE